MKNSEITAAVINLNAIIAKKEKYPVKFSYALTKNLKDLEPLSKAYEEERNKLLDQYNVKDKDGDPAYLKAGKIEIAEEYQDAWEKEMQELLDIEVEFSPHKISMNDLPEQIEPDILYVLSFMIQE